MPVTTLLATTATAIVAGPWLRGLIAAHRVGYRQPLRRHCPICRYPAISVAWWGLVAVAPLGGRCPACGTPVGPPAGAVEAVTVGVLMVLAVRAPSMWVLAAWCWVALLGVALAAIDTAVLRLPDVLTGAAGSGTLLLLAAAAANTGDPHRFVWAVACGLGLGAAYLLAVVLPHAGLGRGDAQLAVALGACLGWLSITTVVTATVAAVILAGAYIAVQLARGRVTPRTPVPFGPFMLLGAFTAIALS